MSNNLSEENQQLLEEKIARLEKALILETRADERLRLEHEIQALKENPTDFISSLSTKNHKNQHITYGLIVFLLIIIAFGVWVQGLSKKVEFSTFVSQTTEQSLPSKDSVQLTNNPPKKQTSEQPQKIEPPVKNDVPNIVIQSPTNGGIAIQGNGTINIHQNSQGQNK